MAPGAVLIFQFRAGNRHAVPVGDLDRLRITGLVEELFTAIRQVVREEAGAILGRGARNHDLCRVQRQERSDIGFAHQLEATQRVLVRTDLGAAIRQVIDLRDLLVAHIGFLEILLRRARVAAFTATVQRADIGLDCEPERFLVLQCRRGVERCFPAIWRDRGWNERLGRIDLAGKVPIGCCRCFAILRRISDDTHKHVTLERHGNT